LVPGECAPKYSINAAVTRILARLPAWYIVLAAVLERTPEPNSNSSTSCGTAWEKFAIMHISDQWSGMMGSSSLARRNVYKAPHVYICIY
jgi:hypothetical protein